MPGTGRVVEGRGEVREIRRGRRAAAGRRRVAGDVVVRGAMAAAIRIRDRGDVCRRGPAIAARTVELVRADVDEPGRVAVVRAFDDRDVAPAGRGPGEAQRQLVGLAARVDQVDDLETGRERGDEAVRVVEDRRVQVAGVGLEDGLLASRGLDHVRVGVPDVGDVVDEVEVLATRRRRTGRRPWPRTIVSGVR